MNKECKKAGRRKRMALFLLSCIPSCLKLSGTSNPAGIKPAARFAWLRAGAQRVWEDVVPIHAEVEGGREAPPGPPRRRLPFAMDLDGCHGSRANGAVGIDDVNAYQVLLALRHVDVGIVRRGRLDGDAAARFVGQ